MNQLKELDVQGLHGLMAEAGERLTLVDVRTPAEVVKGGIRGARHIPLHMLPILSQDLDSQAPLVLYCHSGARSAQACMFLTARGFGNVYNLRGGVLGWAQSGRPVAPIDSMSFDT